MVGLLLAGVAMLALAWWVQNEARFMLLCYALFAIGGGFLAAFLASAWAMTPIATAAMATIGAGGGAMFLRWRLSR